MIESFDEKTNSLNTGIESNTIRFTELQKQRVYDEMTFWEQEYITHAYVNSEEGLVIEFVDTDSYYDYLPDKHITKIDNVEDGLKLLYYLTGIRINAEGGE